MIHIYITFFGTLDLTTEYLDLQYEVAADRASKNIETAAKAHVLVSIICLGHWALAPVFLCVDQ